MRDMGGVMGSGWLGDSHDPSLDKYLIWASRVGRVPLKRSRTGERIKETE